MRQPLYNRLRPFLRRDLRSRLVSALLTVAVLTGLAWLGVSALATIDSAEAHELRVRMGMERRYEVCGDIDFRSACNYDDHSQQAVDREYERLRGVRTAVLHDLDARIDLALAQLDEADRMLDEMTIDPASGALEGDTVALNAVIAAGVVGLQPASIEPVEVRRARLFLALEQLDAAPPVVHARASHRERVRGMTALVNGRLQPVDEDPPRDRGIAEEARPPIRWVDVLDSTEPGLTPAPDHRLTIHHAIGQERDALLDVQERVDALLKRDRAADSDDRTDRTEVITRVRPGFDASSQRDVQRKEIAQWLGEAAMLTELDAQLARYARHEVTLLHEAITDSGAPLWHEGWFLDHPESKPILKAMVRYRSPVTPSQRWQLFGAIAFLLGGIMLVVVGPIVTATSTAREREAGTLPVLRMTGLSAGDLAMAMAIGPNVFALTAGAGLLLLSLPVLALTSGMGALLVPLAVVLALAVATHLTAIGLGDALGQRVNALVVGGLLAAVVLGPGLVGSVVAVGNMANTGLLLGPVPAIAAESARLSGLPLAAIIEHGGNFGGGPGMLSYAVLVQALLGGLCLLSWRRRVEQGWAPLFRPVEGAALALASVGCSAFAVIDLSQQLKVQTYDTVNLITFLAMAFLTPVLGWLLVSSLVRPARASAVASVAEVRRAFTRFQIFAVLTTGALAAAYMLVLQGSELGSEKSEVMWATLAQAVLVVESAMATLLWASRRREGKHRVFIVGGAIVLLQIAFAAGVYGLEVQHVMFTQQPGMPFMIGMQASPYWIALMVVLWAGGLGLVLAALLRERGREQQSMPEVSEEEMGDGGNRWLH